MKQICLAILLAFLCSNYVLVTPATVRPYKFGFTIEEQQHRAEQRDENGIVMGEFGFITADGIYHVTVYATDENGKFRIISMKNYPYAGPVAPKSTPAISTTTRATPPAKLPKYNFNTAACSGCFLTKTETTTSSAAVSHSHKTEIRPLSLPLSPLAAVAPGKLAASLQQTQTQTLHQTQTVKDGQVVVHNGINVQLPFQQSIAQTIDAALAERLGQRHTTVPLSIPSTHAHAQHTTHKQSVIINGSPSGSSSQAASQTNDLDLSNLSRIPPSAADIKDLNNYAFGSSVADPTVHYQLPAQHNLNFASSEAEQEYQHSLHTITSTLPYSAAANPLTNTFTQKDYESPLDIASLPKISPATTGVKDLNSFTFDTPSTASAASFQHSLNPFISTLPHTASNFAANERLKDKVELTMQNVALPVTSEIVKIVAQRPQSSLYTATRPEQQSQHPFTNTSPQSVYNFAADKSSKVNESTLDSKPTNFDIASLPKISPATTGVQDLNSFGFGIPSRTSAASTVSQPLASSRPDQESQHPLQPFASTSPQTASAALNGAKDRNSYAFETPSRISAGLAGSRPEHESQYTLLPVTSISTHSDKPSNDIKNTFDLKPASFGPASLSKFPSAAGSSKDQNSFAFGTPSRTSVTSTISQPLASSRPDQESQHTLQPFASTSPQSASAASSGAKDRNSYAFGTPSKTSAASTVSQPLGSSRPDQESQHTLQPFASNSPQSASAASSGAKDRNSFAFGTPSITPAAAVVSQPLGSSRPEQDSLRPNPASNIAANDRLKGTVQATMKNVAVPVTSEIVKIVAQRPQGGLLTETAPQHKVHLDAAPVSYSNNKFSAANNINSNVVRTMKNVAMPVASSFAELLGQQQQNQQHTTTNLHDTQLHGSSFVPGLSFAAANGLNAVQKLSNVALPGSQQQNTHSTPAHTQSHTHTASPSQSLNGQSGQAPFGAVGNAVGAGFPSLTSTKTPQQQQQQPPASSLSTAAKFTPKASVSSTPTLSKTSTNIGAGQTGSNPTGDSQKGAGAAGTGVAGAGAARVGAAGTGAARVGVASAGVAGAGKPELAQTGDLYHFKYLLDYNGHEETGIRNGNKEGNYFAIGEDDVVRTIEYIANEFGFQPHVSWRKLENKDASLPKENSLKHYEFKWFNKD